MEKIITHLDAHKVLDDVDKSDHFKTKDGVVIKNLHQLEATLNKMSDKSFNHHAQGNKNDFKHWINNVLGDEQLAEALSKCKTREDMNNKIRSRLFHLHKVKHQGICPYRKHVAHGAGSFSMGLIVGLLAGILIAFV